MVQFSGSTPLNSAASDIDVYFKCFDVDDPAPTGDIDDVNPNGENTGPDNFGGTSFGFVENYSIDSTSSSGEAYVYFYVTKQPGDNFRIVASTDQTLLNSVTQTMVDGGTIPAGVAMSPTLTVWRKLHLELDSMEAGEDASVINKNIDDTYANQLHTGNSGAEIHGWDGVAQDGQYEGGTLTVGENSFEIIDNINDYFDDTVYVNGDITPYEDNSASFDDDDSACPLPRPANTGLMNTAFNPAYVEVVVEEGTYDDDAPFVANVNDTASAVNSVANSVTKQRTGSDDFWVTRIISCYQAAVDEDGDPDLIYHLHKNMTPTFMKNGETPADGYHLNGTALIFLEQCTDASNYFQWYHDNISSSKTVHSASNWEKCVVVHETGHMFGCEDMEGNIMTFPYSSVVGSTLPNSFSDTSIVKIRSFEY